MGRRIFSREIFQEVVHITAGIVGETRVFAFAGGAEGVTAQFHQSRKARGCPVDVFGSLWFGFFVG
jgi:hypothetical protein